MTRNVFGRYPRTLEELHNIWEKYNWQKYNTQGFDKTFGYYIISKYAKRDWPAVSSMNDDWTAYSMVSDLFK